MAAPRPLNDDEFASQALAANDARQSSAEGVAGAAPRPPATGGAVATRVSGSGTLNAQGGRQTQSLGGGTPPGGRSNMDSSAAAEGRAFGVGGAAPKPPGAAPSPTAPPASATQALRPQGGAQNQPLGGAMPPGARSNMDSSAAAEGRAFGVGGAAPKPPGAATAPPASATQALRPQSGAQNQPLGGAMPPGARANMDSSAAAEGRAFGVRGATPPAVPPTAAGTRPMPSSMSMRMAPPAGTPSPAPPNNTGSGGGGGGGRVPTPAPPATYRGNPINTAPQPPSSNSKYGQTSQPLQYGGTGGTPSGPVDGNGNPYTPSVDTTTTDQILGTYIGVRSLPEFNPLADGGSPLSVDYTESTLKAETAGNRRVDEEVLNLGNVDDGREFTARGVGDAPDAPDNIVYDDLDSTSLNQGQIDQRRGNDGWLEAKGALGLSMRDGRSRQTDVYDRYTDMADGNGPSVAGEMVKANAQTAATDTELAAQRAGRMMGDANTRATSTYGQATADQAFAAENANQAAQSNIAQGNEQALLAQAALAAGARGGGMGAALRSAQNNTATQTQQNIVQASNAQQAAQRDANFTAANAQREAFAQQGYTNNAAGDAFAQAALQAEDIRAQGDIEAGRLKSSEQLHAIDRSADVASDIRGKDIDTVGAATDVSRAGAELDNAQAAAAQADLDRRLEIERMNRELGLETDQTNINTGLAYDELELDYGRANQQGGQFADELNMTDDFQRDNANMGNRQANVDNETGVEMFYGGMSHEDAVIDANMGVQGTVIDVQSDAAARDRLLDRYGISAGVNVARSGQQIGLDGAMIGAGATVGAAMLPYLLSDERLKKDIDEEDDDLDVPDFRAAQNHSYRYKDPLHATMRGKDDDDLCYGPMAQELPDHAIAEDDDGNLMVPTGELPLQLAPAVGNAQRRLDDVEELLRTLLDADLSKVSYEARKQHSKAKDEPEEDDAEDDVYEDLADDLDDEFEDDEFEDDEFDVEDEDPDDLDLEPLDEEDEEDELPKKKKAKKPLPKATKAKADKGMADLAILLLGEPPSAKKSKSKAKHSHSYGGY